MTATAVIIFLLDAVWRGGEKSARWSSILAAAGLAAAVVVTLLLLPLTSKGPLMLAFDNGHHIPMMAFDRLAIFFKLFAAVVIFAVSIISYDYLKERTPYRGEFVALAIFTGLAIMLVTAGTNLIFIYLSFEFLSITSYVLTGYIKTDLRSTEGGIKYFLYGSVASAIMLYGLSLLYGATGSVDLATIGAVLAGGDASLNFLATPAFILILVGIGFKIALVPFHQWSPDAYEGAPTPITAFLSVGPKAAGLGLIIRLLAVSLPAFSQSWVAILTAVSIITMTVGNLIAMQQGNIKRMMAYSSIAQAGYKIGRASCRERV
jgi:NADH-quinone oxidoreductase subunit N